MLIEALGAERKGGITLFAVGLILQQQGVLLSLVLDILVLLLFGLMLPLLWHQQQGVLVLELGIIFLIGRGFWYWRITLFAVRLIL